ARSRGGRRRGGQGEGLRGRGKDNNGTGRRREEQGLRHQEGGGGREVLRARRWDGDGAYRRGRDDQPATAPPGDGAGGAGTAGGGCLHGDRGGSAQLSQELHSLVGLRRAQAGGQVVAGAGRVA